MRRWIGSDLVILMYHRVIEDPDSPQEYTQPGIAVSNRSFDLQMAFLAKKYHVLRLDQLIKLLQNGRRLPRRCAVITFDDGWRDNFLNAYPILQRHNLPATIFLSTDFIGTGRKFWFLQVGFLLADGKLSAKDLVEILEKVQCDSSKTIPSGSDKSRDIGLIAVDPNLFMEYLKQFSRSTIKKIIADMICRSGLSHTEWPDREWTLTWEDIKQMSPEIVEFGSHGCSHNILTIMEADEICRELMESKKLIEEKIQKPVRSFAYPNGDYNDQIKELVQKAGYDCAVTVIGCNAAETPDDRYALRRINVNEGSTLGPAGRFSRSMFACLIEGIF